MRKYVLAIALSLSFLTAATAVAENPGDLQDEAFLQELAQQEQAPVTPALDGALAPVAVYEYCPGIQCFVDADCHYWCPGGVGGSYCNRALRKCFPY